MCILGPSHRPAESGTLGVGPSHLQTDRCARWFLWVPKFEKHCTEAPSAMLGTEWVLLSHEKEKKGPHPPLHSVGGAGGQGLYAWNVSPPVKGELGLSSPSAIQRADSAAACLRPLVSEPALRS